MMYITILLIYSYAEKKSDKQKWGWGDDRQVRARREVTEGDADKSTDVRSRRVETRNWLRLVSSADSLVPPKW